MCTFNKILVELRYGEVRKCIIAVCRPLGRTQDKEGRILYAIQFTQFTVYTSNGLVLIFHAVWQELKCSISIPFSRSVWYVKHGLAILSMTDFWLNRYPHFYKGYNFSFGPGAVFMPCTFSCAEECSSICMVTQPPNLI